MEFIRELSQLHMKKRTAITLGKFDGLHRGHQKLLSEVVEKKMLGFVPAIFTFDAPPNALLCGKSRKGLLTNTQRRELAMAFGIDLFVQCSFTKEVSNMEPEAFVKDILVDKMKVGYIAVGPDFHFGHGRRGDRALLEKLSKVYGYEFSVFTKEKYKGRDISSTYIREELAKGNMELVQKLLGYPYFITGQVVHGKKIGRTLGIPTVNQMPETLKLLPPDGVYASCVFIRGKEYFGMTNIGMRPTVDQSSVRNVETYVFDFNEEIYGEECRVELLSYERPERQFDSLEELKIQLYRDLKWTKETLISMKKRGKL